MRKLVSFLAAVTMALNPILAAAQEFRSYYVTDVLGSPVVSSDQNANAKWTEDYRPYGERVIASSSASNDGDNELWFTGAPQSDVSGLVYLGNRYYDPVTARFVSIDPVGVDQDDAGNFNRYWYANNNPYRYVDPQGLLVTAVLDTKKDTLTVTDDDTKRSITVQAFTGGKAYKDGIFERNEGKKIPAPNGTYEIAKNQTPKKTQESWYLLLYHDDDVNDYFMEGNREREGVRLHMGSLSHGCVTVNLAQDHAHEKWAEVRDIINNTKTQSLEFSGKHWYSRSNETISYGILTIK